MKRLILAITLTLAVPTVAMAQYGGTLWISEEPNFLDCNYTEIVGTVDQLWVLHDNFQAASIVRFAMQTGPGFTGIFLAGDTGIYPAIGIVDQGIIVCYNACLPPPVTVMSLTFFFPGGSSTCSTIDIIPDPNTSSGRVEVVDCQQNILLGNGASIFINDNGFTCPCFVASETPPASEPIQSDTGSLAACLTIPTVPTTWGSIKALYR